MATVIMSNPNPADPQVQALVAQGAQFDPATNTLIWPDGHPNDTSGAAPSEPGSSANQAGYGYDLLERAQAQEKLLQDQLLASQQRIAQLQADTQKEIAKGDNASAERIAQLQASISKESNRIALLNAMTNQAAEARQERELQARLAANPNDLVAYEFYKRQLGAPQAQTGGSTGGGSTATKTVPGGPSGYESAPPAYSDQTLQQLASSLFSKGTQSWNPNISGPGVFGTTIAPPNTLGRNQFANLSEQEKGILSSFLSAGINIGGRRVAINPTDYFQQTQNSWVPTIGDVQGITQYV